jgi:hypothetical protein
MQAVHEVYAQGIMETAAPEFVDVPIKICSLKRLTPMWRSDFHARTIFEEVVSRDTIRRVWDLVDVGPKLSLT